MNKTAIMEREIKFRGKRVDNGEWVYGSLDVMFDKNCVISYWIDEIVDAECNVKEPKQVWFDVVPETVGQLFTSKAKPNFFEGDIVADTLPLSNETDYSTCYVVTWENFHEVAPTEFVIGNIHENPDLLS